MGENAPSQIKWNNGMGDWEARYQQRPFGTLVEVLGTYKDAQTITEQQLGGQMIRHVSI